MLSYRHAFHAGNHADVLKHTVLTHCLEYMGHKEKPFLYIDTHAGAGFYHLDEGYADKNKEWLGGIGTVKKVPAEAIPEGMDPYLRAIGEVARQEGSDAYPGSPYIARQFLRPQDRAVLFELHPTDSGILEANFRGEARFQVRRDDGLEGLAALLPPTSRRACIFMDPSYEMKSDYDRIPLSLQKGLKRFPQGVYIVWYPLLPQEGPQGMAERIMGSYAGNRCSAQLRVRRQTGEEHGMHGSGVIVLNPPYTLKSRLEEELPFLARVLGIDSPGWELRWEDSAQA